MRTNGPNRVITDRPGSSPAVYHRVRVAAAARPADRLLTPGQKSSFYAAAAAGGDGEVGLGRTAALRPPAGRVDGEDARRPDPTRAPYRQGTREERAHQHQVTRDGEGRVPTARRGARRWGNGGDVARSKGRSCCTARRRSRRLAFPLTATARAIHIVARMSAIEAAAAAPGPGRLDRSPFLHGKRVAEEW